MNRSSVDCVHIQNDCIFKAKQCVGRRVKKERKQISAGILLLWCCSVIINLNVLICQHKNRLTFSLSACMITSFKAGDWYLETLILNPANLQEKILKHMPNSYLQGSVWIIVAEFILYCSKQYNILLTIYNIRTWPPRVRLARGIHCSLRTRELPCDDSENFVKCSHMRSPAA